MGKHDITSIRGKMPTRITDMETINWEGFARKHDLWDMLTKMWRKEPKERPAPTTIEDILEDLRRHPLKEAEDNYMTAVDLNRQVTNDENGEVPEADRYPYQLNRGSDSGAPDDHQ